MSNDFKAVNLTQHPATPEQLAAGVIDLSDSERAEVARLLTFHTPPTRKELNARAERLAEFAREALLVRESVAVRNQMMNEVIDAGPGIYFGYALIGGAPYLMSALEKALVDYAVCPCYAFSRRESVEETMPDGSVRKTAVFRHAGFIQMA